MLLYINVDVTFRKEEKRAAARTARHTMPQPASLAASEAARWKAETAQMKDRALMAEERALVAERHAEEYRRLRDKAEAKTRELQQILFATIEEEVDKATSALRRMNEDLQARIDELQARYSAQCGQLYSLREQLADARKQAAQGHYSPGAAAPASPLPSHAAQPAGARVFPLKHRGQGGLSSLAAVKRAKANGISCHTLIHDMGFSAQEARAAGYTVSALRRAGCSVQQLATLLKCSASELRAAGVSTREILDEGGYSGEELAAAGLVPRGAASASAIKLATAGEVPRRPATSSAIAASLLLSSPSTNAAAGLEVAAGDTLLTPYLPSSRSPPTSHLKPPPTPPSGSPPSPRHQATMAAAENARRGNANGGHVQTAELGLNTRAPLLASPSPQIDMAFLESLPDRPISAPSSTYSK